ncbi:acyl-CoA synthetase [Hoeflea poritis]|uniref:Acyl-CoA synthetase n=1 Tax=Hoeflea poritis TaxID=2993659 RepID=A0ABT4VM13_9HYPH|nr:acyl-CoA synthetase [Hoeflea poritis]MDA4845152.1 acyl-CoA synthetase [Hoeflea poritis]
MSQQTVLRCIDDIQAFEQIPLSERQLPETTYEALRQGAAINPDAPALSFFLSASAMRAPYTLTHAQLMGRITQTANALRRLGLQRNEVAAYILPNMPETHFSIWGGSAAGGILAINPLIEAGQMADLLNAAGVKILITLEQSPGSDIWEKASQAAAKVPGLERILLCNFASYVMGDGVWPNGPDLPPVAARIEGRDITITRLLDEIAAENAKDINFALPGPDDISTMLCTGGTTGLPKIVSRTHFGEVYNSWCPSLFVGQDNVGPGTTALCGLPLFHTNAMLVTGLLPWMHGGHVVLATPSGYRGEGVIAGFWEMVEHYGITSFSGVPTIYGALLQVPHKGRDLSSMRFAACGAAPMPVELFNSFVSETGVSIVEAYGMTEGVLASSMNPAETDAPRIGSIGLRFPYQDMRIGILNDRDEFERWAEVDEAGVIFITGPNVFDGYLIEEQNRGIWLEHDGKRWFNTGDLARQDAEGYFWMTGRKKELIIRGGHNIDPKIVEEAMHKHDAVAMAAVVARPDAKVGEVPVMYYQKASGMDVDKDDLAEFAQIHVPERAAVPKDFICLDALPLTAVGKIHKVTLNMMEIERAIRVEAQSAAAEIETLEVVQDASRGIVAKVCVKSGREGLNRALGNFAFNVDLN